MCPKPATRTDPYTLLPANSRYRGAGTAATWCFRLRLFLLFALLLPGSSLAEHPQITVDLQNRTISPENPTLNIKATESIAILLTNAPEDPPLSLLGVATYEKPAGQPLRPYPDLVKGHSLTLLLRPCHSAKEEKYRLAPDAANLPCPFALIYPEGPTWEVFSDEGIIPVRITWTTNGDPQELPVVVRLVKRRYTLDWSVGFSFFEARDRQYRIDPIPDDPENARFERVSDAGYPYKLAAFAHYSSVRHPSLAFSAGFAFDVPVDTVTAMAGWTWALRTLPRSNSAYLTTGIAYTQRRELRPEFQKFDNPDSGIVPISTTPELLLEDKATVGAFVALTFGFWGGEERFKGVYSGEAPP